MVVDLGEGDTPSLRAISRSERNSFFPIPIILRSVSFSWRYSFMLSFTIDAAKVYKLTLKRSQLRRGDL